MKKKIAITVWEKIQPILFENRDLFIVAEPRDQALRLEDVDKGSDFFFEFGFQDNNNHFEVRLKPGHTDHIRIVEEKMDLQGIISSLNLWLEILRKYTRTASPYDDLFEHRFQQEYYEKINLNEPDADYAPFDDEILFKLLDYLDAVRGKLQTYREIASETDKYQIQIIEKDCETLQKNMQLLSRNEVYEKLSAIWSKSKKISLKLIKE